MQILRFFIFYSRAAVSVFFPPCCPVQILSCALCLHHVFLSEQIKMMMMMMMMMITDRRTEARTNERTDIIQQHSPRSRPMAPESSVRITNMTNVGIE